MLKKILIGLGILAGLVILFIGALAYYFMPNGDKVLTFIKENPDKTAIQLIRNDTLLAAQNVDRMMPLASTVKIIIAIEYAEQAAAGIINPDELVPISELELFYVPNTDGGAHPDWLTSVKEDIVDEAIPIREIAKGMIVYSSNANTEWLSERLGLDRINSRLDSLGIQNHTDLYYIVSALFVAKEKFPGLTGLELTEQLEALPIEDYIRTTDVIHDQLRADTTYKKDLGEFGMNVQQVWSDRLPASTVSEYVALMQKINSRTYFDENVQLYLDEVMEYLLENPANREWLEHTGMKGGSTAFILTKALYATDKEGNTTELAYFMNDLSYLENTRLQLSINEFELNILGNPEFRKKVEEALQ